MKTAGRFLAILIVSAAAILPAAAAVNTAITLGPLISLPSLGMRFKVFRDMKAMPLSMPGFRAIRNDGTKLLSELEWWRFRQSAGVWGNDQARIQIGNIFYAPTGGGSFATEAELQQKYTPLKTMLSDEKLSQWISEFSGSKVLGLGKNKPSLFGASAVEYLLESPDPKTTRIAYLLTPGSDRNRRIFVLYDFAGTETREQFDRAVRQSLGSMTFSIPKRDDKRLQTGWGSSRFRKERSPEYEASRSRVIDNIRNFRDWWYMETENYIFVSNQKDKRTMLRLRDDLERARADVYPLFFPMKEEPRAVSVVRVFNDRSEYLAYIGGDMQWSGALWSPRTQELVISPLDDRIPEVYQQMVLLQNAFHEGFHQYLHYAIGEVMPSMWFNEGMAQFFEGIDFRGSRPSIDLPELAKREILPMFRNGTPDVAALIKLDRDGFYDEKNLSGNYQLARALCFYLMKGCMVDGNAAKYGSILRTYYDTLLESGDAAAADAAAWKGVDLARLSADLKTFWNDEKLVRRAERYNPLSRKR